MVPFRMSFFDIAREQRRRHHRRRVQLPARVRLGVHEIKAVAENISPGGAFLRVSLPEGARRLLAVIDLPHGKRLSVEARVCWHRADGVGIQFESFHR